MTDTTRIDTRIPCPYCNGTGQDARQSRRYGVGMNWWIERSCGCCQGDGRCTPARVQWWHDTRELREKAGRKGR